MAICLVRTWDARWLRISWKCWEWDQMLF